MVTRKTLRGGTRLTFDLVEGVTDKVEAMHETIARHPLPRSSNPAQPRGAHGRIAALVYSAIRGTTGALREGVDAALGLLPEGTEVDAQAPEEIRALGALNGVLGDHLEVTGNTLAIPMGILHEGDPLVLEPGALRNQLPQARGRIVIFVHGLCLTELCWHREDRSDLAELLAGEMDCTALHVRYNSGRHISTNGQALADLLEQLHRAWPVDIESLVLIGHSMGGLVIRSACWYAEERNSAVLDRLRHVVCLGTPHHGSMVERAGHAFDLAMEKYPYVAPLAVGRHRSAGIKDLHYGDLLDEDWQDHESGAPRNDNRRPVPLLPGVEYCFAAAVVGDHEDHPLSTLLGDLLVRVDSATGEHPEEARKLPVPDTHFRVFKEKDHFDLLTDERVHQQVLSWIAEAQEEAQPV